MKLLLALALVLGVSPAFAQFKSPLLQSIVDVVALGEKVSGATCYGPASTMTSQMTLEEVAKMRGIVVSAIGPRADMAEVVEDVFPAHAIENGDKFLTPVADVLTQDAAGSGKLTVYRVYSVHKQPGYPTEIEADYVNEYAILDSDTKEVIHQDNFGMIGRGDCDHE